MVTGTYMLIVQRDPHYSDYGCIILKELVNPFTEWIHWFLYDDCTTDNLTDLNHAKGTHP